MDTELNYYIVYSRKGRKEDNFPIDRYSIKSKTREAACKLVYSLICSFGRDENIIALGWKDKKDFLTNALVLPEFNDNGCRINQ